MAVRHSIDLNELLEGSWMEQARQRARIRLIDSIQSKEGVQVAGGDIHTEEGRLVEAFSFYYARLVMCASEDERLIARWAQAEAARAEQLLTQDLDNLRTVANTYLSQVEITHTTPTAPLSGSVGAVGMSRETATEEWRVGLADFIELCPKITGHRWRLPNVDVDRGWVKLHNERQYASSAKVARLLRERIKAGIEAEALEKMGEVTTDLKVHLKSPDINLKVFNFNVNAFRRWWWILASLHSDESDQNCGKQTANQEKLFQHDKPSLSRNSKLRVRRGWGCVVGPLMGYAAT